MKITPCSIRQFTTVATLVCFILCGLAGFDQQSEDPNWSEQFVGVQAGDDLSVKIEQACAAVHAASRQDGTAPLIYCSSRGEVVLQSMLADSKTINGSCGNFAAAFVLIMGELGEIARQVQLGGKAYISGDAPLNTANKWSQSKRPSRLAGQRLKLKSC